MLPIYFSFFAAPAAERTTAGRAGGREEKEAQDREEVEVEAVQRAASGRGFRPFQMHVNTSCHSDGMTFKMGVCVGVHADTNMHSQGHAVRLSVNQCRNRSETLRCTYA